MAFVIVSINSKLKNGLSSEDKKKAISQERRIQCSKKAVQTNNE